MIVYAMNRLPLAQESNQNPDSAFAPELEAAPETAVPAPMLAKGSGSELAAAPSMLGVMQPDDEDDPIIIKKGK